MKKSHLLGAVCACIISTHINSVNAAAVFYTNEANFNASTSGISLSLEGFETPFATAPVVSFSGFTIASDNNTLDLESRASEENGGPPSTEGVRLSRYYTDTGAGGITITFDSPINAFSIDIIDPIDINNDPSVFLSMANSNGDSQILISGGQSNNSVLFAGITDLTNPFNSVTIFSTKSGDAILLDRLQFNAVPLPPALWLFGSGLLGLIGVARKKAA